MERSAGYLRERDGHIPGLEDFYDEAADFFDLILGSDPIWNADENDSAWCLEPHAQREAADGADSDLPMLSEEDYTDLYPMACTQEQCDQLMAEYPMVDVADLMVAHLEYTAKVQSEATAATES
ncbi:hypothetical protein E4U09_007770 [Claviceps aff. purpurea]|uniref:Uncharacterized protein n=1 Tax=Claviceps aff. purpurea TaxID=1967640 RepID=A0A9P7U2P2_9HYPO|nr:hypothetical protein E4U09_007770 [Claviceps aff. purpurea]